MADWMNVPLLYFEGTGRAPTRVGLAHPSICPYGAFATADGSLVLISIQNEREWANFCRVVLGAPDLPNTPGYESNSARMSHRGEVDELIANIFAGATRDEIAERLNTAGTAYGFVNSVEDLGKHPALRRVSVETPNGPVSLIAPPTVRNGQPIVLGAVPAIGQHGAAIRTEFQGEDRG
jgi:crotonobetainyl-CoA:carnitine CoA-transferase CaiB-like acyl-CoA transferase